MPLVTASSGLQTAASEAWESGGVGAYECYIAADDEELTAAEVYGGDEDEGNQLLSVPPVRINLTTPVFGIVAIRMRCTVAHCYCYAISMCCRQATPLRVLWISFFSNM